MLPSPAPSRGEMATELKGAESPLEKADPTRGLPDRKCMQNRFLLEVHSLLDGDLGCVWTAGVEVFVRTLGAYWGTVGG